MINVFFLVPKLSVWFKRSSPWCLLLVTVIMIMNNYKLYDGLR